jgi:hypothetical protein
MDRDKPRYIDSVIALVGNPIAGKTDGPISELKLLGGQNPPNEKAIQDKLKELQADYDSKKYQRDRAVAYPPLADQMDLLYHGGVDALKAELKKTKDKFPKP